MAAFGLRMMSIGGIANLANCISDFILGRLLGTTALGLYSRAHNLSDLIFQNLYGTATRVVFVQLSKDYRERGAIRDTFLRGLQMITAVMGPVLIGLAILSKPVILTLYGEKWMDAAIPLSLLLIAQFISLSFSMNWELFVVRDELHLQVKLEVSRSIFGVITTTIGSLFSIVYAAAASIVDAIFSVFLYSPHMKRLAESETPAILRVYFESTFLTAVAVAPAFALMVWSDWRADISLPLVFGGVTLGILMWVLGLYRQNHPLFYELQLILTFLARAVRN
jgi:O-antigen/teichoic acid export membrane protein